MKRRSPWLYKDEDENAKEQRDTNQHVSATPVPTNREQAYSVQRPARSFIHEPLEDSQKQIRLLRMLPNVNFNEHRLQYSISTYDFTQVEEFIAISYTWGDPRNEQVLHISDSICPVGRNCHYVLKSIYQHWRLGLVQTDLLWIDTVCINQRDQVEKSVQVSFMGEIYAKAAEVLACVGPHADDSEFLFEKAREVNKLRYECIHKKEFLCQDCRSPWERWVQSLGIEQLTRLCVSCETFGRRLYWTRIWIIQEVAKATSLRILCGTDILPWTAIHNLEDFLAMEMDEIDSLFATYPELPSCEINSMHDVFRAKKDPLRIEQVFSQYQDSSCSEPRDRLYGLLGLIDWPNELKPIFPDYKLSILDAAVQIAPYFAPEQIVEMLTAFQVTTEDTTIQSLILQRQQVISIGNHNAAIDTERDFGPLYNDSPVSKAISARCTYLLSDRDNVLTAILKKKASYAESTSSDEEESDASSEEAREVEEPKELKSAEMPLRSQVPSDVEPQPLMLGSEVIGYICSRARGGDILVSLSSLNRCLLVMRQSQDETLDIIGQGLLLEDYEFEGTADDEDSIELAPFSAQIELKIAAVDVILLFAMDIEKASRYNDLDDCWRHALTNVTSTSFTTAQVTERTQMHAQDGVISRRGRMADLPAFLENHPHMTHGQVPAEYSGWIMGLMANDDQQKDLNSDTEK